MFAKAKISMLRWSSAAVFIIAASAQSAYALPWDWDMSKQQSFKANEISRAPVEGTVPLGFSPFTMTLDEASEQLSNPSKRDADSIQRGRRLWSANCAACHGLTGASDGPVAKFLQVPNILEKFYMQDRSDGRIFAVIYHGQNQMPRYGYKFTADEQWDLVNYVRYLQGFSVQGVEPLADKEN